MTAKRLRSSSKQKASGQKGPGQKGSGKSAASAAKGRKPAAGRKGTRSGGTFSGADVCRMLGGVAEALQYVVDSQTEVVVHDLRRPESSIVAIVNGHVSDRREGQSVLSVPEEDAAFAKMLEQSFRHAPNAVEVTGNYNSRTRGGKPLRSSSVVFYDDEGAPGAALCLNRDLASAEKLLDALQSHIFPHTAPPADDPEPREAGKDLTMEELVNDIIEKALACADGVDVERMTKQEKMQVVKHMHQRGLFLIRGSVERAAASLGITKFTIYNYMDELGISR